MSKASFSTDTWAEFGRNFDTILNSLMSLGSKRVIHQAHIAFLDRHEITDGTTVVHHWMQENYADSMLIGLRRVLDTSGSSLSLIKLLEQLEEDCAVFTIDRYLRLFTEKDSPRGSSFLRMLYSKFSSDGTTLDRRKIRADIDSLLASHSTLLEYIESTIVRHRHTSSEDLPSGPSSAVSWADLDRLFDDVVSLFNKYYAFVEPGVYVDFAPVLPAGFEQAFLRQQETALHSITSTPRGRLAAADALSSRLTDRIKDARAAAGSFTEVLDDPGSSETDCQNFITEHPWLIGLDYASVRPKKQIIKGELDFILERYDGFHDILELKSPQDAIITVKRAKDGCPPPSSYSLSPSLSTALAQTHAYREILSSNERTLEEWYDLSHSRAPKILVVIGRLNNLDQRGKEILDQLNRSLHRVEIIPYDVLRRRAESQLDNLERYLTEGKSGEGS